MAIVSRLVFQGSPSILSTPQYLSRKNKKLTPRLLRSQSAPIDSEWRQQTANSRKLEVSVGFKPTFN